LAIKNETHETILFPFDVNVNLGAFQFNAIKQNREAIMSKRGKWIAISVFVVVCTVVLVVGREIYLRVQAIEALDIQVAAREGDLEEARRLLQAAPWKVNAGGEDGVTPLHMAVMYNHKDVAELLITEGANLNSKDREGVTPLDCATTWGYKDLAELLIAKGANVNAEDDSGRTALHEASAAGYIEIVQLLVSKRADVNAKNEQGKTPLEFAKEKGHAEIVELLRKHGAEE